MFVMRMKLITRDTDYAINALYFIAENKDRFYTVTELVERLNIPRAFLRKILQILNRKGIVKSFRGKGGGFRLNISPEKIFLMEIMDIFQGKFRLNECILNKKVCPRIETCTLKKKLDEIEKSVRTELKSINIGTLLNQ
jgi:Rrf2 family protein